MPVAPYVVRTGAASRSARAFTASPASRAPPPIQSNGRSAASIRASASERSGRDPGDRGATAGEAGATSAASRSVATSR